MGYCGLDFGTTNSTLSYIKNGQAKLAKLEKDKDILPSAIFYNFEDDTTYYGRQALSEYIDGESGRLMRSLKSILGTSLMHDTTQIKTKNLSFVDIIANFLRETKIRAEQTTAQNFDQVVLGRPIYFIDGNENADKEAQCALEKAALKAGFKEIHFQYEPIAAALDYENSVSKEELAMIIDLGGGTSDFSVVRVSPESAKKIDRKDDILSTGGVHIGGVDFDRRLSLHSVMPHLGYRTPFKGQTGQEMPVYYHQNLATWHKIHFLYDKETLISLRSMLNQMEYRHLIERLIQVIENKDGHRIAMAVEAAKIQLTDSKETKLLLDYIKDDLTLDIHKNDFDASIENDIERLCTTAKQTVFDADIQENSITKIFMTGGTTSIPAVREALIALFPNAQTVDGNKFGSVGVGLSLQAQRIFKS